MPPPCSDSRGLVWPTFFPSSTSDGTHTAATRWRQWCPWMRSTISNKLRSSCSASLQASTAYCSRLESASPRPATCACMSSSAASNAEVTARSTALLVASTKVFLRSPNRTTPLDRRCRQSHAPLSSCGWFGSLQTRASERRSQASPISCRYRLFRRPRNRAQWSERQLSRRSGLLLRNAKICSGTADEESVLALAVPSAASASAGSSMLRVASTKVPSSNTLFPRPWVSA
mmetsp:Transcript_33806/g.72150  ORF Transcript_33806/g.72150 Transcript_33806/m.72150 type:complete len:231 (+) Transcript_33806:282-974(+)